MRYLVFTFVLLVAVARVEAQEKAPPKITFDDHVKPIFQQKCFSCHNPDKKSSDLDLTNFTSVMQGGAAGAAIEPGDASASYLYELVTHASEPIMPPESPKIPDEMIETLRKWIEGGVLENAGSTAKASKKKKFEMGLAGPSTERPAVVPMPGRMSLQPVLHSPHRTAVDAIATSPWAPLAALSSQKQVLLYNTQTLELLGVLPFPEGIPRVLKFSRNGKLLLAGGGVGGASGRVVVWDIQTGERIIEVGSELDEVLAADISSDQKLVALAGPQRVVRIYATETGQLLHEIRKHTEWVTTMEFSPDSVLLATGDRNGGLFVWEGWTGREYLTLAGHTASVTSVSWRSDSNIVASSSEDTTIRLWEMENGGQVKNWGAHGGGALAVEFTRDSRLFSSGRDNTPKLWDQNGAQQIAFEAFADLAVRSTFCDETNRAISGDWSGEIRVWNAADGVRVGQLVMNVPPLEARLAEATQLLTTRQGELQPIADAFQVAQASLEKVKAEFAMAQQQAAEAKQKSDAAAVTMVAAKELMTKAALENETIRAQADALVNALPSLKNAAEMAAAAAGQIPDNASLATAAGMMKTAFSEHESKTNAAVKAAAEKLAAMQKAQQDFTVAEKLAGEMAAVMTAAQAKEQQILPTVKPAEDAAVATKTAFDQSTAALQAAQQLVLRWNDEIAFNQKMVDLSARRAEATRLTEEKESSLAELQLAAETATSTLNKGTSDLTAAQVALAMNQTNYPLAVAATEAAKQAQAVSAQAKLVATNALAAFDQVIAKLNETNARSEEALAMSKDDAGLATLTQMVKTQIAEKTQQHAAAKADLVAKTQAEVDAINLVAANEKAAADLLAAQPVLQKTIAELTSGIPALQKLAQETAAAVEAMKPSVAALQEGLNRVNGEIAAAKGLQPSV